MHDRTSATYDEVHTIAQDALFGQNPNINNIHCVTDDELAMHRSIKRVFQGSANIRYGICNILFGV